MFDGNELLSLILVPLNGKMKLTVAAAYLLASAAAFAAPPAFVPKTNVGSRSSLQMA